MLVSTQLCNNYAPTHPPRPIFPSNTHHLRTGKLLNTLVSGLSDRSAGVRKAYAKTIGHLVKVNTAY